MFPVVYHKGRCNGYGELYPKYIVQVQVFIESQIEATGPYKREHMQKHREETQMVNIVTGLSNQTKQEQNNNNNNNINNSQAWARIEWFARYSYQITAQRARDAIITSSLRPNDVPDVVST